MKFCISGRQPKSVLKRADEIKFQYKDCERILDYLDELNDKTFIITIPVGTEVNWNLMSAYNEKINLILGLTYLDIELIKKCISLNIKFYNAVAVNNWYDLNGLIELNPSYLFITGTLYFDLEKIKNKANIPIRLVANNANDTPIPRKNGVCGTWIRPEDVDVYGEFVDAIEFMEPLLSKEETLLHVYKEKKEWPGNLNLLLTNFGVHVDNRAIPEDLGKLRMNCGHRCMRSGTCKLCINALLFADAVRNEHYKRKANKNGG